MAILPVSFALPSKLSLPTLSYNCLSSFSSTSDNLSRSLSSLSLHSLPNARTAKSFTVRMGGGPRTFPGGVSKWQWKRMQKKKASQLLKARLMRERQIYEMRKRAELKAAVSELERPWQVVEQAAPNLFSVGADEQVKVLADRFQKPGGFDLWTENDGPQLFETPDGLPTARFFPKGVVHSVKPYGRVHFDDDTGEIEDEIDDVGMKSEGRLKDSSNSGFDSDQRSGEWLNRSGNSMKQGRPDRNLSGRFSESEDSDEESSHFLTSRGFSDVNRRQSGQRNVDRIGSGSRRDGDRNPSRRFSETEDSDVKSSYSSNSRVFNGVNRHQSGQSNIDQKGNGSLRDGDRNFSGRFSDWNVRGRFNEPEDIDKKGSYSSNSGVFSRVNRYQSGQRNIDQKGNGGRRDGDRNMRFSDQNLNGRFGEPEDSNEKSSYSSNYRPSSGVNRHQSGQKNIDRKGNGSRHDGDRNLSGRSSEHEDRRQSDQRNIDGKGSGSRRDGDFRKLGSRSVGSGWDGAIKFSDSRQLTSSPREQRNNSKAQIGGYNRSRRDSKLEKRRNSSVPEDVYDMSLQTDGSYSFGSRTSS